MTYEIEKYSPCEKAVIFRAKFKSFKEAWDNCPRGDWMLWIAKRLGVDFKTMTLAKVRCAQTVIHLMKDERSLNALTDEVTIEDLNAASAAAAASDADAYAYAYAYADADAYAREKNRKQTADICRLHLTKAVFEKLGIES